MSEQFTMTETEERVLELSLLCDRLKNDLDFCSGDARIEKLKKIREVQAKIEYLKLAQWIDNRLDKCKPEDFSVRDSLVALSKKLENK